MLRQKGRGSKINFGTPTVFEIYVSKDSLGMSGMPEHAHIKLHDQFVALIGMKLHAHNQIYTFTNFLDIKALRTPLGMPGLAWSHLLKLTKSVCNNNRYDAVCTTSNNAATILTDSILNIYKTFPEKTIKPNTIRYSTTHKTKNKN